MDKFYRDTVIEIDLDQIKSNIMEVKEKCSKDKFLYSVIKGDAYGHGIVQIGGLAIESGADGLAVATMDEAMLVRKNYPDVKILYLGVTRDEDILSACENEITITVAHDQSVAYLADLALPKKLYVHMKANTGMNRIGYNNVSQLKKAITALEKNPQIVIEGIFTHFATADEAPKSYYMREQLARFKEMIQELNYDFKQIHCTNSGSLLKLHDQLDFTTANRFGVAMYAALQDGIQDMYNLKGGFILKTKIIQVSTYPKGTKLSYGCEYTTQKDDEQIATLPIGYADGFNRMYTNTKVKCGDQYGIISGRVCMDQCMVRFDQPVKVGDEVILISNDPEIDVYRRSEQSHTITQEVFVRFNYRVPRIYYKNGKIVAIDNYITRK